MEPNGKTPKFRAEIGMSLVLDSRSYGQVGDLMDKIAKAMGEVTDGIECRFDFVSFNTHPCKGAVMHQLVGPGEISYVQPELPPLHG